MVHVIKIVAKENWPYTMRADRPDYWVLLNGARVGELYYNMTGYVGLLPLPDGRKLQLRESGISTWKKEAAKINAEAKRSSKQ